MLAPVAVSPKSSTVTFVVLAVEFTDIDLVESEWADKPVTVHVDRVVNDQPEAHINSTVPSSGILDYVVADTS
jgi:hypothetical protein